MHAFKRGVKAFKRFVRGLFPPDYPDDPAERRRIKMFILGAGVRPGPGEKMVVHTEKPPQSGVSVK